jgi:hypothetical protein
LGKIGLTQICRLLRPGLGNHLHGSFCRIIGFFRHVGHGMANAGMVVWIHKDACA